MTARDGPVLAAHVSICELLDGLAVVALVPATAELDKAAAMAWELARTAANAGRKVALVDCHVDEPQLHTVVGEPNDEGIVDVFEYGASLSRIARQQPEENLYFLPAGTFAPNPAALMRHQRWRRLAAGFRHEDAVMLLFVPAEFVGAIAPNLDGLVALAPGGADAGLVSTPEIQAAVNRGVPLLATVSDTEWPRTTAVAAATESAEPAAEPLVRVPSRIADHHGEPALEPLPRVPSRIADHHGEPALEPLPRVPPRIADHHGKPAAVPVAVAAPPYFHRHHEPDRRAARARWGLYAPLLLLAVAAAAVNYRVELGLGDLGLSKLRLGGGPEQAPPTPGTMPGAPQLVPHAVDSLPFAVQVSAWTSLAPALDAADALEGAGFPPIISPLRLGTQLWYRVYVGPVTTQDAADSLRGAVRAAGFDRPLAAVPVLAPWSVSLQRVVTPGAARGERARLRAAGIPAFVLGLADGSYKLLAGAFQTADQAGYLDSLLTSTGRASQIGPRVGFRP